VGGPGTENIQKDYERNHYLIENKVGHIETKPRTKLKRTPIECEMSALSAPFELIDAAIVPAGVRIKGSTARFETARVGGIKRNARKYKNRGNKAKEWLKTKDITFLKPANWAF